jgi:RNA polymerase sigma-70 factor (ECF subfamily)
MRITALTAKKQRKPVEVLVETDLIGFVKMTDKKIPSRWIEDNDLTKEFMSLLLSNQKQIYIYILSIVVHPSDADDILQDTLTEMWRGFAGFQPGTNFVAWGKTIAKYKILNYRKKNKNSKLLFDDDLVAILETESIQLNDLPERLDAMKTCSKKLTEKELHFLKMRYELGLSFRKIASQYGVSKQRIYSIISHIHLKLARCIKYTLNVDQIQP